MLRLRRIDDDLVGAVASGNEEEIVSTRFEETSGSQEKVRKQE